MNSNTKLLLIAAGGILVYFVWKSTQATPVKTNTSSSPWGFPVNDTPVNDIPSGNMGFM